MNSPNLFVFLIFAVVIGVFILGAYLSAQRRKMLAAWAAAAGFSFDPGRNPMLESRYPFFQCLQLGYNRYAYNVMSGSIEGRDCLEFDYHYTTGSGKSREDHTMSAVILESKIPLRQLYIRPETFFDHIAEFIGFEDIHFESNEFSRRFHVHSPDRKWAFDVISQDTMQFLLDSPTFYIQFGPTSVIAYRTSVLSPPDFDAAANVIKGMYDRLPDYLVKQQGGEIGAAPAPPGG